MNSFNLHSAHSPANAHPPCGKPGRCPPTRWSFHFRPNKGSSGSGRWHVRLVASFWKICLIDHRFVSNGALSWALPRLINSMPERAFAPAVLYWRGDQPPIAKVNEALRKRIVELSGNNCRERTDGNFTNVEWSKKGFFHVRSSRYSLHTCALPRWA